MKENHRHASHNREMKSDICWPNQTLITYVYGGSNTLSILTDASKPTLAPIRVAMELILSSSGSTKLSNVRWRNGVRVRKDGSVLGTVFR